MSRQTYNWKRFWCPREGFLDLSDGGYLREPNPEWDKVLTPSLVSFENLIDIPCLILLGEPGIGKSYVMQSEKENLDKTIVDQERKTLWLNLRAYGNENRLVRNLFETPEFSSWLDGTHTLYVFLDSLDECLLQIKFVAALLVDELSKYPTERLYLRIACRTADWPNSLEKGLQELWGEKAVRVYELAPLTRNNVTYAANANELSPNNFLREIDRMNVVSLAIKPITLQFLIATYRNHGHLPGKQAKLYCDGCQLLCEETNPDRRTARLTGTLTAEQRMVVAARIAAITTLCNRNAVWTDVDYGDMPDENIKIQDLCGGKEYVNSEHFPVTETAIQETLATGLFTSRGPQSLGWAHQTYAEFLAAWYLVHRQMTIAQMLSLLIHSGELGRKLIPQLSETAAWLAGMVPDIFQEIMRTNPEVLLRSDVAAVDAEDRVNLVATLLNLYDNEQLSDRDWGIRENYKKLKHPGLAEQLRPYILGREKGIVVRRVATDIAEACELQEVQEDLLKIVLDVNESHAVRVNVAWAMLRAADEPTKAKLKPLVLGQAGVDPDDDLKGCGLLAMWPNHLSAKELFTILTLAKRDNYTGAYQLFLGSHIVEHLNVQDLPLALHWTEGLGPRHELRYSFQNLMDAIFLRGWQYLDEPDVLNAYVKATWARLQNYGDIAYNRKDSPLVKEWWQDDKKRRLLIQAVFSILIETNTDDPVSLVFSQPPLVISKDVLWMLEHLRSAESEKERWVWVQLIRRVYDERDVNQQNAVYDAYQDFPVLEREFAWFFGSVALDSPQTEELKRRYKQQRELEERRKSYLKSQGPPVEERVHILLERFELGDLDAWWELTLHMRFSPKGTSYYETAPDLTKLPGWETADTKTRERIIQAAKQYLTDYILEVFDWIGTNTFYPPAFAGYKALMLLHQENPNFVNKMPVDVWQKWISAIVAYPITGEGLEKTIHQKLVKIAYSIAPDETIEILRRLIDHDNEEHGQIFTLSRFEDCWNDVFANAILGKVAEDLSLAPGSVKCLLEVLLEHNVERAKAFAESMIHIPFPENEEMKSRAIFAALVLITSTKDAGWPVIWPAIQNDNEFGKRLFLTVAENSGRQSSNIAQKLTESQLADLYIWLSQQFPHTKDPQETKAHFVTPREDVGHWRDSLLNYLQYLGSSEACSAIQHIAHTLPELEWMRWVLLDAKNIARRKSWNPPQPETILTMIRNQDMRFVQSGDELLEVTIESLKRLEQKLHDETPAVRDIWDSTNAGKYQPILENPFSDYVKRHLDGDIKQRGIIANREVELRSSSGAEHGERTDIHIDAVAINPTGEVQDIITVIIEVKGCWHEELETAIQTQLVERYLKDNHCQHGLYLVGWFNCTQWDDEDYKKGKAPSLSVDEAQTKFDTQATELSKNDIMVKAFVMDTALR